MSLSLLRPRINIIARTIMTMSAIAPATIAMILPLSNFMVIVLLVSKWLRDYQNLAGSLSILVNCITYFSYL